MKRPLILVLFISILSSSCVHIRSIISDGYTTVRIDKTTLKSSHVLDQGTSDLCYAFVTATLLDGILSKGKTEGFVQTSPVGLGVAYAMHEQKREPNRRFKTIPNKMNITDGGNIYQTFAAAQDIGLCSVDQIPVSGNTPFDDWFFEKTAKKVHTLSPKKQLSDSENLFRERCPNPVKIPTTLTLSGYGRNDAMKSKQGFLASMRAELIKHLNSEESMPVAANICMDVLYNKNHSFYDENGNGLNCKIGRHAVVVVGVRTKAQAGTTQVLVRNSFGPTCKDLDPAFGRDCDGGQFWIDIDRLIYNTIEWIWIDS